LSLPHPFLIFTSASGIADEGGWGGVDVKFDDDSVTWSFLAGDEKYHFVFSRDNYIRAISSLEQKVDALPNNLVIEPEHVFFPEEWEQ